MSLIRKENDVNLEDLKGKANDIRVDIVEMVAEAGSGHPGGSLSSVEILCALYFGGVLDHDASDPEKEPATASFFRRDMRLPCFTQRSPSPAISPRRN